MVETFYLHLEFKNKKGNWSINLPFLCNKCGVCCTLDDFLTAGEIKASPQEQPQDHAKLKVLYDELGKLLEKGEAEYNNYVMHTPCPFLTDKSCSIYPIRPEGCRQFPNTTFGMLTPDCEALNRFKHQRAALRKGRNAKETYHFTTEPLKQAKLTQKQFQNCMAKLQRAGITGDELALLSVFNGQEGLG
jgi:Fe-S-cluster containining protein